MHWADVIAQKLLKKKTNHVLATGITPSGPIHIGNMREILTTDAVYRALREKKQHPSFLYIADDYDPLRKVYPYLPKSYEQYVGMPISDIPCPCGDHNSYADHYLFEFLDSLKEVGVKPTVHRANEMYKNGDYNQAIQTALDNTQKIRKIIETISKRQLPKHWLPFNIRCEHCNRIGSAKPVLYEYPIIEYTCACGYEGEIDIRKGGVGKLPWRVDWPARWKMLQVTFEPCGKDLATVGGARDTGKHIVEEIYHYPHPEGLVYEFIMLKGKGAMHSSKGTALSAAEMLQMTPPEVLRFLLMRNQPERHIVFDSGLGLLSLVDEYDTVERAFFKETEPPKGIKDLPETYRLSQPETIPQKLPVQLPFRHLVTIVQIGTNWKQVKNILQRTNQIPKDLTKEDEKRLQQRATHARYWLQHFAPDMVKFTVQKKLPTISLTNEQQTFLNTLTTEFEQIPWEPEEIHNAIYNAATKHTLPTKQAFTALYLILLGQKKGPRAGYFLSTLDQPFVLKRIKEAIK